MKSYSFLDTVLLVNGIEISGFYEGDDTILLERLGDSASHSIGADGEMTVSLSSDRSGHITFKLNHSSTSNAVLSTLISGQENGIFVPVAVQFKDVLGGDLGSGTSGYIPKPAGMQRGSNSNMQEWKIVVERLDLLHVGNAA